MFKNDSEVKLSIITVVFNNREGLCRTLESVKRQTFCDFEQIVIDGGSTDGTLEEIQKYESQIANFRWISEKDNGIYNAMNKGIKMAKGEYCYFLNSDDCIAVPKTLEEIFEKAKDVDIIYGNLAISENNKPFRIVKFKKHICFADAYNNGSFVHHQASFIRRKLFEKHGLYREDVKAISDWIFFYETIVLEGTTTQYVNRVFSLFEKAGLSLQTDEKYIRTEILKKTVPLLLRTELSKTKQKKYTLLNKIYSRFLLVIFKIKGEI